MDDGFDFTATVRIVWSGAAVDESILTDTVEPQRSETEQQIANTVRCVLRTHPPEQPAAAEYALNAALSNQARQQHLAGVARWRAYAWVDAHETVRAAQQTATTQRLNHQAEYKQTVEMINSVGQLVKRWRELLAELGVGTSDEEAPPFLARHLVRLALQPTTAPAVLDALSADRDDRDKALLDTVTKAVRNFDNVNLYAFEASYDSALRRLMDWAGIAPPDSAGGNNSGPAW